MPRPIKRAKPPITNRTKAMRRGLFSFRLRRECLACSVMASMLYCKEAGKSIEAADNAYLFCNEAAIPAIKSGVMNRMSVILLAGLLCLAGPVRVCFAAEAEEAHPLSIQERFQDAYHLLVRADESRDAGNLKDAFGLYRDALGEYIRLARKYPDWQQGVVRFRSTYCDNQLDALIEKLSKEDAGSLADLIAETQAKKSPVEQAQSASAPQDERELNLQILTSTAELSLIRGDVEKARGLLMEGLHLAPDNHRVRLLMGLAQCLTRKFDDAVYILEQVITEIPENAEAHVYLSTAYFGLGRLEDAEKELKKALELDPGIAEAHYNLAQVFLALSPPNLNVARIHYRKAVDLGVAPDRELELILE